jgi:hypothetical protein
LISGLNDQLELNRVGIYVDAPTKAWLKHPAFRRKVGNFPKRHTGSDFIQ